MNENNLIIAAAGSGKTTFLVKEVIKRKNEKILLTTFTIANEAEIKSKFYEIANGIPDNVTIQTWFSFLLQHGVRPYQGQVFDKTIKGLFLVSGQSVPFMSEEKNMEKHFFTNDLLIYSDKIAKFVIKCNEKSNGAVIDRLSRIYQCIFIDEVQDLAGYDLNFLQLLFKSKFNTLLVGDPRQGTYSTNNSAKNKKFTKGKIIYFFDQKNLNVSKDETSFLTNWRCNSSICNLSNELYPLLPKTLSGNSTKKGHDGVFFIKKKDVNYYLKQFQPIQLRYDSRTAVNGDYDVRNFGDSKGLEFDRVLIYPPSTVLNWLKDKNCDLAPTSRSKFYVAITRAKFSVGIVYDYDDTCSISGIENFIV